MIQGAVLDVARALEVGLLEEITPFPCDVRCNDSRDVAMSKLGQFKVTTRSDSQHTINSYSIDDILLSLSFDDTSIRGILIESNEQPKP